MHASVLDRQSGFTRNASTSRSGRVYLRWEHLDLSNMPPIIQRASVSSYDASDAVRLSREPCGSSDCRTAIWAWVRVAKAALKSWRSFHWRLRVRVDGCSDECVGLDWLPRSVRLDRSAHGRRCTEPNDVGVAVTCVADSSCRKKAARASDCHHGAFGFGLKYRPKDGGAPRSVCAGST